MISEFQRSLFPIFGKFQKANKELTEAEHERIVADVLAKMNNTNANPGVTPAAVAGTMWAANSAAIIAQLKNSQVTRNYNCFRQLNVHSSVQYR